MTSENCRKRPFITRKMDFKPRLTLMQANAVSHQVAVLTREVDRLRINHMFRPAISPGLNPVE